MDELNTALALNIAQGNVENVLYGSTTLCLAIAILFVVFFVCAAQKIGELLCTLIYNLYLKLTKRGKDDRTIH